ncbi:hypothetical protein QF034_006126 [Streptomyces africanus]|uniref:Uncharacterized protein n=1 Tax=Streptomyces africanus TaxID=231024 RepID=A0ABU0QWW8_9ACTN|nr:hypothetical protein [Streptomyces africanus]MDQ0751895.1 hypothetical protein [Streptomyces africanus]
MIRVSPAVWGSFPPGRRRAVVIVEEPYARLVRVEPTGRHAEQRVIAAGPGSSLTGLLAEAGPDADVLVLAADEALLTADPQAVTPRRTVAAARLGTGADPIHRIRRVLRCLAQQRPAESARREKRLLRALDLSGSLTLTESLSGSRARIQRAEGLGGTERFTPGRVHAVPPAWLVMDTARTLGTLTGAVTVKGNPVVGGGDRVDRTAVYDRLTPLVRYPLVLDVRDGRATPVKAVEAGSDLAAATLERLFEFDPGMSAVTAVAFGSHDATPMPPYGTETGGRPAAEPVIHILLGGFHTRFQLALPCATTTVRSATGGPLLEGPAPRTARSWRQPPAAGRMLRTTPKNLPAGRPAAGRHPARTP